MVFSLLPGRASAAKFGPHYGWGLLCLFWAVGITYAVVSMQPWLPIPIGHKLVFNEMMANLLQGRFDISPATIGAEAVSYNGRSYAYFGIFCAFLRLPLLLTGNNDVDITAASILIAAALSLACRLYTAALIINRLGASSVHPILRVAVIVAVLTNGESIQFLIPSIYQEVISWGSALASLFVLLLVRIVLGFGKPGAAGYAALALVAGLALLCRVTFGLGAYCAIVAMLGVQLTKTGREEGRLRIPIRLWIPAASILALFAVLAMGVNYARWGNPLTFVPVQHQEILERLYPDRAPRMEKYGALNIERVPFSLQYYFAPIWAVTDKDGRFLLQSQQVTLFDDVEFPPSSLILSDSLFFLLAAIGLRALIFRPQAIDRPQCARAALAGLMTPWLVMLMAISLTHRYRMEFYPALDFAAYMGLSDLVRRDKPFSKLGRLMLMILPTSAMALAFVTLVSYGLLGPRPATDFNVKRGWIGLLEDRLAGRNVLKTAPDFIRQRQK